MSSATSPVVAGSNAQTQMKKPSMSRKKPREALGSPPPPSVQYNCKQQKVSGAVLAQSIEQLNDVAAVSGINLRNEEDLPFFRPKEDSRALEASKRVVQQEEKFILQKIPLQKKLAEILAKCGLKSLSSDVERCLSLCTEERMRGLISSLIRLSKQRFDIEKARNRTIITSDVGQQIMILNRKAQEEWQKKRAEAEKLQRLNEPDMEKDDIRIKSVKANKEENDKMLTAANVAAQAAVGGSDVLSKWQLIAQQAQQKCGVEASVSHPGQNVSRRPLLTSFWNSGDNQGAEKMGLSAFYEPGAVEKKGRCQIITPQSRVALVRTISVRDVISVLEREHQMSEPMLIYRLYEEMQADAEAE